MFQSSFGGISNNIAGLGNYYKPQYCIIAANVNRFPGFFVGLSHISEYQPTTLK